MKHTEHDLLGKIPGMLTFAGIILSLFSLGAIAYALYILFFS